ncbi:hypothetical protein BaRGS_00031662 [Batillaria attramentaria]|uniref:Biogenesis of lysosome-related organelles complex 1 subunit 1 n=1 Tax=Batillaria attramentaria TaxID=370345 RepID=A0ABD0JQP4_9CAEN
MHTSWCLFWQKEWRDGVAQAYVNQKKLDTETRILQANAAQFSKQTLQWLKLVEDFNTALKEIGDVENWAKSIETDMRTISSALEYAYRKTAMLTCHIDCGACILRCTVCEMNICRGVERIMGVQYSLPARLLLLAEGRP